MKIILSPAKKMKIDTDILPPLGLPIFLEKTEEILSWMKKQSYEELKSLWKCNEKIALCADGCRADDHRCDYRAQARLRAADVAG